MPVPVPKKQPAHPISKPATNLFHDGQPNLFSSLTATLPVSPAGPPPSFGTREEWINSLPSWRRAKPRQTWSEQQMPSNQYFFGQGLAIADNAQAIKGTHAQACSPPHFALTEMLSEQPTEHHGMNPTDAQQFQTGAQMDVDHPSSVPVCLDYERGAFTPVFEDQSPLGSNHDDDSSPLEPVTPFGHFIDRSVSAAAFAKFTSALGDEPLTRIASSPIKALKEEAPQEVVTPTATSSYRKLAGPLSEWVANYIWRACTSPGNANMTVGMMGKYYPHSPPSSFATSIHSLLLSTLLQPSAVFLALWYIARLPVSFLGMSMGSDQIQASRFRSTLLGEEKMLDRDAVEANAPFRLAVVGCMLANKWLDDHTFSNKTWHTISNVPIRLLNRLESLALEIFSYDLSVSSSDWSHWLAHLVCQHTYISSPVFPQPIGRPSASPQAIVRKALEEIIQARTLDDAARSEPVFLNVEERRRERLEQEQAARVSDSVLADIDLDEDGPLRDEYLPRKRHGNSGSRNLNMDQRLVLSKDENMSFSAFSQMEIEKNLPPPAKWSPAGDEPILRDCNRVNGHYVAVQPPGPAAPPVQFQVLATYQRRHDSYSLGWSLPQPNLSMGYYFDIHVPAAPAIPVPPPADPLYSSCQPMLPIAPPSHSRSQSLSVYDQTAQHRARSYSQVDSFPFQWHSGPGQFDVSYPQAMSTLPSYAGVHHQPAWLRA